MICENYFQRGCSSLHYAVGSESIELLHRLIDAGANLNAQSKAGHTALHLACQLNRIEAAEELVKRGINISIKDVVSSFLFHLSPFNSIRF